MPGRPLRGSILRRAWPWAAAMLSGLGLAAAFPPLEEQALAWFALVPLLLALRGRNGGEAFRLGFLSGLVFWGVSLSWLLTLRTTSNWATALAAWASLALYSALYSGAFGWSFAWAARKTGMGRWLGNLGLIFWAALLWVGWEYLRGVLFTGFPWNLLGVSQYRKLSLIQVADWGGVYAVSGLIVLVNTAIACTLLRYAHGKGCWRRQAHPELMVALLVLAAALVYGWKALRTAVAREGSPLRVALIQPNIPQDQKWTHTFIQHIQRRLQTLTQGALRVGGLDLIVWPETALPGEWRTDPENFLLVRELASHGVPLLVGSLDSDWKENQPPDYFNSALLIGPDGELLEVYDKQHLVPFGEYVPLERWFPFIRAMTPIETSIRAGTRATLFRQPDAARPFAVLICFEDAIPGLARRAVRAGARWLINQTNDAWFDPSCGAVQHRAQGVFRSIENRVPTVRAANSGISCAIDARGKIYNTLADAHGVTRIAGFRITRIWPPGRGFRPSFYTRHGDLFAQIALAATLLPLLIAGAAKVWRNAPRPKKG